MTLTQHQGRFLVFYAGNDARINAQPSPDIRAMVANGKVWAPP